MLDRQSRVILKHLISIADGDNIISDIDQVYLLISRYTEDQINDSIGYLHNLGFINAIYAENGPYLVEIYYKGLHFKDFDRIELKQFIMQSVFTPIIVSIITTLIALWINGFFTTEI